VGPTARGMVWGVPGGRVRAFQPLALAAQQTGNTSPYRGRGPQLLESSCLQRAPACLGSDLCPFDHSRGSPRSPPLGLGRAGHGAVVAAVSPAPFLVAETGGSDESGLVEPRRNLSQDVAATWSSRIGEIRVLSRRTGTPSGFAVPVPSDVPKPGSVIVVRERDRPGTCATILRSSSYEVAMRYSESDATQERIAKIGPLMKGDTPLLQPRRS
jgi:hypothetical protein